MVQTKQPNIILIVVDQMRADALSLNSKDKLVSTPTLDMMASVGYNFENAYSPVPSCVPARAALLTGLDQDKSGRVGYQDEVPWNFTNTLPKVFKDMGYQTECIGKMHVFPSRQRLGFDHVLLHDGYLHVDRKYDKAYGSQFDYASDYLAFLKGKVGYDVDLIDDGMDCNSWEARPWDKDEKLHPTNWVVSESISFLQRRDPTVPFFLKMSFEKPHAPLNPPKYYFDMYMERLPQFLDLHIGNWEVLEKQIPSIYALRGKLKEDDQRRMVAAYFGLITHIDHQISRFLTALKEFRHDKDTIIWFVSDHGDQLGEHYLFRKGYPYQGSIHIPSFIYDPAGLIAW
ncbi:arylsulfatase [Streptococcus pneumoniae]|nr:arylsulfatase [Streptococcus pneumoniae]